MTREEAKQLALEYLAALGPNDEDIAFYDDLCRETRYGWILLYNSKRFIETGDMLYAFGGNGPLVVIADTREVVAVSTAGDIDEGIRAVERSRLPGTWGSAEIDGSPVRYQRVVFVDDCTWLCKDDRGRWFVVDDTTATEVTENRSIAVLRLLERSPAEAASEIHRAHGLEADNRTVIAPVQWVLAHALRGPMDYWAALALTWIEWYGHASAVAGSLSELSHSKWASQSTRHRAKRLAISHR